MRRDFQMSWGGIPGTSDLHELAENDVRTVIEVRRQGDRRIDLTAGGHGLVVEELTIDGWSDRVFEQFFHLMQTGEPGGVHLAAHHERDASLLAWVWRAVMEHKSLPELRDLAFKDGRVVPPGAWEFVAKRDSPYEPTAPR